MTVVAAWGSASDNLQTLYIPDSYNGISGFSDFPNLTSVYLGCQNFNSSFNNCPNLTYLTVGPNYKYNGGTCFNQTTNLKELTWNAISAEQGRLDGGSTTTSSVLQNLETLTFGNQVQYIPPAVANYAVKLKHVTIPTSVTAIGEGAFYTSGLVDIYIPNSVVSIDRAAFSHCNNLTDVVMENSVTSIGNQAFAYCSSLKNVNLSDSLTRIPGSAFYECTSLNKIVIPKQVTDIGNAAFRFCDSLKYVYLPDSLKQIERLAFYNCPQLEHIYCPLKEPQNVNIPDIWYTFFSANYAFAACTLHVPKGTLPLYQELSPWNKFTLVDDYEQCVYTAGDVNGDGTVTASDVTALYNLLLFNDNSAIVNGDQNGDSTITSSDVTFVYNILLGL